MTTKLRLIGYRRSDREPEWPDPTDFVDEQWEESERHMVANYLQSATIPWVVAGFSQCRICGKANGSAELTDGVYVWPEGLAHYVSEHGVRLPIDFIEHVMSRWAELEHRGDIDRAWWRSVTPSDRYSAT